MEGYSDAFQKSKEAFTAAYFWVTPLIAVVCVAVAFLLLRATGRINRRTGRLTMPRRLCWATRVLGRPFDGFGEIKYAGRANVCSATILLAVATLSVALGQVFTGYVVRGGGEAAALLPSLLLVLLPVGLFVLANWCLTSLLSGEGNLSQIYIVTCYSLTPLTLLVLPLGLLSNFLTLDDLAMYRLILVLALGYTVFLLFAGMLTIHNYSVGKSLLVLLLTAVGMVILVFLAALLVELAQQMLGFLSDVYTELSLRT